VVKSFGAFGALGGKLRQVSLPAVSPEKGLTQSEGAGELDK